MRIDLEGYDIDNLLRLLYLKKVRLYNLTRKGQKNVTFEIDDRDAKKVKRYISNYKAKTTERTIKRLPKFIVANLGLVIGVFLGIIFCIFASNFTWQILVYGTEDLSTSDIIKVLADNGVKVGQINHETSEDIEAILLKNYDKIAQVSVIREGTAIIINLSEKLVYDDTVYEPIVARYNGIVTDINIITGTTNVKIGDYVNAGDVLVLPFNLNALGEKVSVEPMAEIKGKIFVIGKAELAREEVVLTPSGRTITTYEYKVWGKHLFFGKSKNSFAFFEFNMYNEYISRVLPITRTVTVYSELVETTITHDFASEREALVQESIDIAYNSLVEYDTMLDEHTIVTTVGDKMTACTTLTLTGLLND